MSKKTENIYLAINELNALQKKLADYNAEAGIRELDEIQFQMQQNLKNLRFWIDSLYSYNGKSTSRAKKLSSRENGKKGGRPPKEVTAARRRISEIENILLPQIEHDLKMTDDLSQEKALNQQKEQLLAELTVLKTKLTDYEQAKNN